VSLIAESAKGQGGAGAGVLASGIVLVHFDFEGGALQGQEAQEAPTADGHVFGQSALDFVLGIEVALDSDEEVGEGLEIFIL